MRDLRARAAAEPAGALAVAGSAAVHAAVALTLLAAGVARTMPVAPIAYRVNLVAAPAAGAPAPASTTPAAAAPAPAPQPVPAPTRAAPAPAPTRPAAPATAPSPAAPPLTAPAAAAPGVVPGPTAAPGATPGTGADPATIRTEGVEFPFPGYLRNLVAQVYRRWRPPSANQSLQAEVFFLVHRDGTVTGLQFIRRSGSFAFDLEAQGAVEAAARASAFGTLPAGYGPDVLPVTFFFSPQAVR